MSIDILKKKMNLEPGAILSSFEVNKHGQKNLIEKIDLDERLLIGLIDILSHCNCTIELEGYHGSDRVTIDIPITGRFLSSFGHPLITVNSSRDETIGWEMYSLVYNLVGQKDTAPHYLRLDAYIYDLTDEELKTQEKLILHSMDLKTFEKRAQVIAASTYIEAMITIVSKQSLEIPDIKKSWRDRLSPTGKDGKKNKITPNFSTHIDHIEENGILKSEICKAINTLRLARNASAHNYKIYKNGENASPIDHIEVTHLDEAFISKSRDFIDTCRQIFGETPRALGNNKFQRYAELLAGEISKSTSLESVLVLGLRHSTELEEVFG